ncbi:cytochrome ubiquinol oxidase subunit I [Bacillus cereus]
MKEVIVVWKRSNWHGIQFASTTIFHYFFVPLSIGLAFIIALMQTLYVVKGQEIYKKMTKFWTQIFLVNFAVGVVTRYSTRIPVWYELVNLFTFRR